MKKYILFNSFLLSTLNFAAPAPPTPKENRIAICTLDSQEHTSRSFELVRTRGAGEQNAKLIYIDQTRTPERVELLGELECYFQDSHDKPHSLLCMGLNELGENDFLRMNIAPSTAQGVLFTVGSPVDQMKIKDAGLDLYDTKYQLPGVLLTSQSGPMSCTR